MFFAKENYNKLWKLLIDKEIKEEKQQTKMMTPEFIDNVNKTLKSSLKEEIKPGSKISIAAACFSIYAYQELQNELKNIDELRFIFTSPAFITEKAKKEKREFYIPRLNR